MSTHNCHILITKQVRYNFLNNSCFFAVFYEGLHQPVHLPGDVCLDDEPGQNLNHRQEEGDCGGFEETPR